MTGSTPQDQWSDRLSWQIASLQESCSMLTSAATLKELATRFLAVLSRIHQSASVELFFRRAGGGNWRVLSGAGGERSLESIPLPGGGGGAEGTVGAGGRELTFVQQLMDKSHLAIRLCRPDGELLYGDDDLLSLRLHAHLFDVGHQRLLSHGTEKDLIFSLNHRVL